MRGNAIVYDYDLRGRKTYEGGATYPVRYTYDIFGNKTTMMTYRDETSRTGGSPVQGDVTTWLYDIASGSMTNKVYADGKGPTYSYTPDGKLTRRIWARGIVTDYSYDIWGGLTNTVYSDSTPTIALSYDAMGRQTEARDAAGLTAFLYDSFGSLTNETVIGVAGTNSIDRFYDNFGRDTGYALNGIRQSILGYDSATARLLSMQISRTGGSPVQDEATFSWSYLPGSDLKSSLAYPNGLSASWAYDAKGQLLQVCNAFPTNVISQYDYTYDVAGRRVACGKSGSAFAQTDTISYAYNNRSELTNAVAAVDSNYRYAYDFDDIGNRETSFERGTNSVYAANQLNQYTEISNSALSASPRETFTPQFDDDGNQTLIKTATGIWSVTYNGENRPIVWECVSTNSPTPNSSNPTLISMSYDRMGRRVTKNDQGFMYDGYLQIADNNGNAYIWDPTEPVATRPLAWLVLRSLGEGGYYTHDGNKNVSEVVAENGDVCAHYDYAPFGAVTSAVGDSDMANPWRFSSEYAENETDTVYYNYRHYNPTEGRWAYRDLFENLVLAARLHPWRSSQENLYSAVNNRTSFAVDALGLTDVVSDQEFPGAHQVGNKWWLYVDDGQNGTVTLIRKDASYLNEQMRIAAKRLCRYARDDGKRSRDHEGSFDTEFFMGEGVQHQYYLIAGQSRIWADNEVNYIGIGMYEAWIGDSIISAHAIVYAWKALRWHTLPTEGTFYWLDVGYGLFDDFYSGLDPCTCEYRMDEADPGKPAIRRIR